MSLTIPANPAAGFTHDAAVRVTTIDGIRMVSAYDVIKLANQCSNPHVYWTRVVKDYPELTQGIKSHKFSGGGQRETPVLDAKRIVILLNVIPGKAAASFRLLSAEIMVRYLGGDDTLVAEINKNAEAQEGMSSENPMSLFGDEVKRKREENNDEPGAVTRDIRMRVATIKEATEFLVRIDCPIDEPAKLLLKDMMFNVLAPYSTRLTSHGEVKNATECRHQIPISDLFLTITGRSGTKSDWIRIGAAVAKEYRVRHPGREPATVERFIDGTTRMVKAYSLIEDPWIDRFVRQITA